MFRLKMISVAGIGRKSVVFFLVSSAVTWPTSTVASEKRIEVEGQRRGDAVAITKVTLGDSELQCGVPLTPWEFQPIAPFEAGDDWLRRLTIYIFNHTNKTIVHGQIILEFPETGDGKQTPMQVLPLTLGRLPQSAAYSARTGKPILYISPLPPISFAPGQTMEIRVKDFTDRGSISDNALWGSTTRCIVRRGSFFFEDGMRWYLKRYSTPDPFHPGRFNNLEPRYFPGDERLNWPPGYSR